MSTPKLHHYVPRFYLKYFTDNKDQFWVWNKENKKTFKSSPYGVAAENYFYRIPEFIDTETNPLVLEFDLSKLESDASKIIDNWIDKLDCIQLMEKLTITKEERKIISFFISMQFFRTAEQRKILTAFSKTTGVYKSDIDKDEEINLHSYFLYREGIVDEMTAWIDKSIWIFARNTSDIPIWTSDNPVCFKTKDNYMWLKGPGIMSEGSYIVYPLTPQYILYCKESSYWDSLKALNNSLSPVELTSEMVEHENAGQVFSATRFVISTDNEFTFANEFVETIGTDIYKRK